MLACLIILLGDTFIQTNNAYLDQKLHASLEAGKAHEAIQILREECVNDIQCGFSYTDAFTAYELMDFQPSQSPAFDSLPIGVIPGVLDMTPTTAIHVTSPSVGNITWNGLYQQISPGRAPVEVSFTYTLGPNVWLRLCAADDHNQFCTDWKISKGESVSGKETFFTKSLKGNIKVNFQYHCKDDECLMLLRKLQLYKIRKVTSATKVLSSVIGISEKSIELIDKINPVSSLNSNATIASGGDFSSMLEQLELNERAEAEGNMVPVAVGETFTWATPGAIKLKRRRKRPIRPTPPPVSSERTTTGETTCRSPTATTTESTTTQLTETKTEKSQNSVENGGANEAIKMAAKAALMSAGIATISALIKGLLVFAAAFRTLEETGNLSEELEKQKNESPLAHMILTIHEGFKTAPDDIGLWLVPSLFLSAIPFGLNHLRNTLPETNAGQKAWYECVLILRSHGPEIEKADLILQYSPFSLPFIDIHSMHTEKLSVNRGTYYKPYLSTVQNQGLVEMETFARRNYAQWDLRETSKGVYLNVSVPAEWFELIIDHRTQNQRLQPKRILEFKDDFVPYVTFLNKEKTESVIQTSFFGCRNVRNIKLLMRYQLFAHSPDTAVEICVRIAHEATEMCGPTYDASRCSDAVCVVDMTPYAPFFVNKYVQIIVKVKAQEEANEIMTPRSAIVLLAMPDDTDLYQSEKEGQNPPCYKHVYNKQPLQNTNPMHIMDCLAEEMELEMIIATRIILTARYYEDGEPYSASLGFRTLGLWYESQCTVDFNQLPNYQGPPDLLSINAGKPFSVQLPNAFEEAYLEMTERFRCVAKKIRVIFYLSTTAGVSADVCIYHSENIQRYMCGPTYSSRSYGYPTMIFEADFEADTMDIRVRISADDVQTGSATFMMKDIEITC